MLPALQGVQSATGAQAAPQPLPQLGAGVPGSTASADAQVRLETSAASRCSLAVDSFQVSLCAFALPGLELT